MNTEDYEKAKQECWEKSNYLRAFDMCNEKCFDIIFYTAYKLGMEAAKKDMLTANVDSSGSNVESSGSNVESLEKMKAKPKFKVGQRMYIKYINMIGTIDTILGYNEEEDGIYYHLKVEPKGAATAREENLEPYTELKENFCQVEGQVKESVGITTSASTLPPTECDKDFDDILKRGFQNHNRLQIAAMIMASIMGNAKWSDKYSQMVQMAFAATDALLEEAQKGDTK